MTVDEHGHCQECLTLLDTRPPYPYTSECQDCQDCQATVRRLSGLLSGLSSQGSTANAVATFSRAWVQAAGVGARGGVALGQAARPSEVIWGPAPGGRADSPLYQPRPTLPAVFCSPANQASSQT